MTADNWVSLVEYVVWPIAVVVVVLVLRRQIGAFLDAVGGRITKVSVMSVSIDLAMATEVDPPWRARTGEDVRGLVAAGMVNDSYFDTLRQSLALPDDADYFVADLKRDGSHQWLTSRLYLFGYLLSRVKGVRCVVFTATRGDVSRSYLGVADVEDLLRLLGDAEPWLRAARIRADEHFAGRLADPPSTTPGVSGPAPPADPWVPPLVDDWWRTQRANPYSPDGLGWAQHFLSSVQWLAPEGSASPDGWLALPPAPGTAPTWEHAEWVGAADLVDGRLAAALRADNYVANDRSWSAEERTRRVTQAGGNFVALIAADRRFDQLIDRVALLEKLGETAPVG
jgi:hypothetical protein